VEVDELTRRNAELKSLLNQYLGDNVTNAAFRVPPAQVTTYSLFLVVYSVLNAELLPYRDVSPVLTFLVVGYLYQVMKVRDVGGTMGSSVGGGSNTYNSTGGGLGKAGGSGLMDNMLGSGSIAAKGGGGKNVLPKKAKQGYSKTQ